MIAKPKKRIYFLPMIKNDHRFPDQFGFITSPLIGRCGSAISRIRKGYPWICDNGAFKDNFDPDLFFDFLQGLRSHQESCLFAVCPDKYLQADKTLEMFDQYAPRIREMGFPVAFVAQDGQENLPFPDSFDALFVGGSDPWKMSPKGSRIIKQAQKLGKWIHIGRVNSRKRIRYFSLLNVDSFDGTHIIYSPDKNRKYLIKWMSESNHPLFYI